MADAGTGESPVEDADDGVAVSVELAPRPFGADRAVRVPGGDAVLDRLGTGGAVVPAVWPLEVANVLLIAERRRRLSEAQSSRFAGLLAQLPIDVDDPSGRHRRARGAVPTA